MFNNLIDVSQETVRNFLSLIRLGIGKNAEAIPETAKWCDIAQIATRHGLSAVLVDGVEQLTDSYRPPQEILLQLIGETLQGYECRYKQYCKALSKLAGFYNSHGFKMMILKGYSCSLDWPKPNHRPCGDIDVWLFGKQKEADILIEKGMGIKINKSHHHHTVFDWDSFMVENHYDFINTSRHSSHQGLEIIFKKLGKDDTHSVEVCGEMVYLPSPNLQALFLLRHALNHFASMGITIRQILDWAFFVEKHTKEIDWDWLNGMIDQYHMSVFVNCLNTICVEDLGFDATAFNGVKYDTCLKDKVLAEIMQTNDNKLPQGLFYRMLFRYRRWKESAWKYQLCFDESRTFAFWNGLKSAVIKPSSI